MDTVDQQTRSRIMASIRNKDTLPEVTIRKELHVRGFRYRTHVSTLPGKPDIVFAKHNAVILVHGCFWHGHDCELFRLPATRPEFWATKIQRNRERDQQVRQMLADAGWRCLTIWECAIRGNGKLEFVGTIEKVTNWLKGSRVELELRGESSANTFSH